MRLLSRLYAACKQKVMGIFLTDLLTQMQTESIFAHADNLARYEALAREYEQSGKPETAAFLRAAAEQLNFDLSGLAGMESGMEHLLTSDLCADPPAVR